MLTLPLIVADSKMLLRRALPLVVAQATLASLFLSRWNRRGLRIRSGPRSHPAVAVGATALGAVAVGAMSLGAVSLGALAVFRMKVRLAELDSLHIRTLTVDTLTTPHRVGLAQAPTVPAI